MEEKRNEAKNKILLVDDSQLASSIMSDFLESKGYKVDSVTTGEEALIFINHCPNLDLILMDIELAGKMSGVEAAREIQKNHDIPIVFFTANTSDEIRRSIREVNAYGYLVKGMERTVMLSTIEMAIKLHEAHESATMYRHIIENQVNEVYVFQKSNFQILQSNLCARERTGYSEEELKKLSFLENKPLLKEDEIRIKLDELLSGEHQQVFIQTLCVRKDQSKYPIEIDIQKIRYNRENCFFAVVSDLTEKNIMKDQLNNREAMLSAIVNSAQDGLVILDDEGQVILWNQSAERILGYEKSEIIGRIFQKYCSPGKTEGHIFLQDLICKDMIGRTVEVSARNKSGFDLELEISVSDYWMGQLHQIILLVRDISQRKKWQKDIQASRTQYLELAENSPIGIARCDLEGNVDYINHTGARYFELDPSSIIGKYNLIQEPAMQKSGVSDLVVRCIKECSLVKGETDYDVNGKKVTIRLQIKPMQDLETEECLQLILDDITEVKKLENELRTLSQTDPLTGAFNRRFFMEQAQQELTDIHLQGGDTASFVMMDIDWFKQINDQYGHKAGDEVLIKTVDIIKNKINKRGLFARWGGEEFVILLCHCNLDDAYKIIGEIREEMNQILFWSKKKVTASFGVVEYREGDSLDSVISRADDYMYEAKSAGRDCIRGEK